MFENKLEIVKTYNHGKYSIIPTPTLEWLEEIISRMLKLRGNNDALNYRTTELHTAVWTDEHIAATVLYSTTHFCNHITATKNLFKGD